MKKINLLPVALTFISLAGCDSQTGGTPTPSNPATAKPEIHFNISEIRDTVIQNRVAEIQFPFTNDGEGTLRITTVENEGEGCSTSWPQTDIPPGASNVISIICQWPDIGRHSVTLKVKSEGIEIPALLTLEAWVEADSTHVAL